MPDQECPAACYDGNEKGSRLGFAGKAGASEPVLSKYFHRANRQVQCKTSNGTLTADSADDNTDTLCGSNLTCWRNNIVSRAYTDRAGILGGACPHSFPLEGLYVDMYSRENGGMYYEVIFHQLVSRPDLKLLMVDVGCRLQRILKEAIAAYRTRVLHVDGQEVVEWEGPQLKVPMMHAFDHDIPCQLRHSVLFRVGFINIY